MKTDKDYLDPLGKEVVDLHIFFEDWFSGNCENTDEAFEKRLLCRMDKDFFIVLPGGMGVGSDFFPEFRKLYGTNADFKISIRNVQERACSSGDLIIATYEEWQKDAKYSEPPNNGRLSTAVMIKDSSAPNGLKWAHVHETWMPADQVNAESFDW